MTRPPLVLLPPSKGKATGGRGRAYGRTLRARHPLTGPRRAVLDALAHDVPDLDDRRLARLAGVPEREVGEHRAALPALADAPTLAAHRRYTGIVHGNAGLAARDPATLPVEVVIVSALLGLVTLDEAVPHYRVELAATTPSLGGLATFWRRELVDHLAARCEQRRVWDLLPGEHRRVWASEVRAAADVVEVAFVRPDGRPANAARTKVAKGRLAAHLCDAGADDVADVVAHADLGEAWSLTADDGGVTATHRD